MPTPGEETVGWSATGTMLMVWFVVVVAVRVATSPPSVGLLSCVVEITRMPMSVPLLATGVTVTLASSAWICAVVR